MATSRSELPEARLNPLLRRVDWRFLLPHPTPDTAVCLAEGDLREAVGLISRQVADKVTAGTSDVELAVAVDPSQGTLARLFDALRPGGSCYTEWYAFGPGARGIRRRLETAGFRQVRCYIPWRTPPRCQLWLPLGAPGAMAYFQRRPLPFPQLLPRLRSRAGRLAAALGVRLDLVRPVCAVAQKPPAEQVPPLGPATPFTSNRFPVDGCAAEPEKEIPFRQAIDAQWPEWESPAQCGQRSWALLTGGQRSICKVVGLAFAGRNPGPQLIVKMARVPESIPGLAREAAALRALAALGPGGVPGVPRVLFHLHDGATAAVGETVLQGVPLTGVLRRRTYRDLAMKATAWSADLAAWTRPGTAVPAWERRMQPVFAEFAELFGPILDLGMLRATSELLATVPDLPAVCEQRDFSPWNLLLTPDRQLAVLDWESAELDGLPALDLIYFLTYLGFTAAGLGFAPRDMDEANRFVACYRNGLRHSTFAGRVHQECLADYCDRIGLAAGVLPQLRLFAWMLHSRSEYRHFLADTGGRPKPATLRRSLFVRLWEHELRCAGTRWS